MTVAEPRRYRLSRDRPAVLDVGKRWLDVRRVARAHPGYRRCLDVGWEREDLDAEVLVRVLARQSMPSRYDPRRAGVGKYLWVTCGGILANLADLAGRDVLTDDGRVEPDAYPEGWGPGGEEEEEEDPEGWRA